MGQPFLPSDQYYQKWRWATHGVQWCPTFGVVGPANETYIERLIHDLVALDPNAP